MPRTLCGQHRVLQGRVVDHEGPTDRHDLPGRRVLAALVDTQVAAILRRPILRREVEEKADRVAHRLIHLGVLVHVPHEAAADGVEHEVEPSTLEQGAPRALRQSRAQLIEALQQASEPEPWRG